MSDIILPYKFNPRFYQEPIFSAIDSGYKRILMVHGRRLGKDLTCWNLMVREAFKRKGLYLYLLPTGTQAKRVVFDGLDNDGRAFLDYIPIELIDSVNKSEMKITLVNGSMIKLMGSEDYDKLRGMNPVMIVISEAAYSHPEALEVVRPMLRMNKGIIVLNSTPNGKNWFYDQYSLVKDNKEWFVSFVNKETAIDAQGNPYVTDEDIANDRAEGMSEEKIKSEYYCDFNANSEQYIFMKYMHEMEELGRLGEFPYLPELPVHTAWDLGIADATGIWFFQEMPSGFIRMIDYEEASGKGLPEYIKLLNDKPYVYGEHYAPHDIKVREFGTGKTRVEMAEALGIIFDPTPPKLPLWEGIEATRQMLRYTQIDAINCKVGVDALMNYQKEFDARTQQYRNKPRHDWASHAADAMRTLAINITIGKMVTSKKAAEHNVRKYYKHGTKLKRTVGSWKTA